MRLGGLMVDAEGLVGSLPTTSFSFCHDASVIVKSLLESSGADAVRRPLSLAGSFSPLSPFYPTSLCPSSQPRIATNPEDASSCSSAPASLNTCNLQPAAANATAPYRIAALLPTPSHARSIFPNWAPPATQFCPHLRLHTPETPGHWELQSVSSATTNTKLD